MISRLASLVVVSLCLVSCSKPKEGGSCEANKGTCLDKENALVCIGGKFAKVQCRKSATGCMEVMGNVTCDVVRDVGVPCSGEKSADWRRSRDAASRRRRAPTHVTGRPRAVVEANHLGHHRTGAQSFRTRASRTNLADTSPSPNSISCPSHVTPVTPSGCRCTSDNGCFFTNGSAP